MNLVVARITQIVGLSSMLLAAFVVRWNHPHLTETELFIEFWPLWLTLAGSAITIIWAMGNLTKRGK